MKKLLVMLIAVASVVLVGSMVLGVGFNTKTSQAIAPQNAANAQASVKTQSDSANIAVSADRVGVVGVLQAIGSSSLSLQTREGLQLLAINGTAGIDSGSSAIDKLKAGDKVAVWAQKINGQVVVTKIVVVPQSPGRTHYVGLIANVAADHIDVVGQQGETTSFRFDSTLQRLPDAKYTPQVGDTVTLVAKGDPLGSGWYAVAIVKQ
jgi:Cu/Ag efflux protein CusF